MQNLGYVFAAYAIVWLALFGYLFVVATQMRAVRRDVDYLQKRLAAPPPGAPLSGPDR